MTILTNNVQIGKSAVAAENFTINQPAIPDGTIRISTGNASNPITDILKASAAGVELLNPTANTTLSGLQQEKQLVTVNYAKEMFSNKNYILNGGFQINQLGNTGILNNGFNSVNYPYDRWYNFNQGITGAFIQSASVIYDGYREVQSMKIQVQAVPSFINTLSSYWTGLLTVLESYACIGLDEKPLVVSFLFRTNVSGKFNVSIRGLDVQFSHVASFVASASDLSKRIVLTIPKHPTNGNVFYNNPSTGIYAGLTLAVGFQSGDFYKTSNENQWITGNKLNTFDAVQWSNTIGNFIEIAEVKLETGYYATPFEYEHPATELAKCQRYLEILPIQGLIRWSANGNYQGAFRQLTYRVEKPAVPITGIYTDSSLSTLGLFFNSTSNISSSLFTTGSTKQDFVIYNNGGLPNVGDYASGYLVASSNPIFTI